MRDLLKPIENNIAALRFAIEFDIYDLTREQQEAILNRLDQVQMILENVKSKKKVGVP